MRFLPPLSSDHFYLYVKDKDEPETLITKLRRPFKAFADSTWLFIVGALIFAGAAFTLVEFLEGRLQEEHPNGNIYRSFSSFVGGGSHADNSAATKSLVFGFNFFLMLTLSACESVSLGNSLPPIIIILCEA